ncbi:hypothetical protein JW877_00400, partial [bacterium]|nr:hypothetical protein [bacterium]
MNKLKIFFLLMMLILPDLLNGEAGVLIPKNTTESDALQIQDMEIIIDLDNQYVKTQVIQIYRNNINIEVEGEYQFMIPENAAISNFAIWEEGVRIEGVVMEKVKAREIYEDLTWRKIDPGLMESATDLENINLFTVDVFPIPPFGTKRIEIEYTQCLEINSMQSYYIFPLKPSLGREEKVESFHLELYISSDYPISDVDFKSPDLTPVLLDEEKGFRHYQLEKNALQLDENFSFSYIIDIDSIYASFLAFRDIETIYKDIA